MSPILLDRIRHATPDEVEWLESLQEELVERLSLEVDDLPVRESAEGTLPPFRCLYTVPENVRIEWLVETLLVLGEFGIIAGRDGVMKTTIALLILLAVAGGHTLFGKFATTARPVLLISGEDPDNVLRNRAAAICRGHGWNLEAALQNVHVLALDDVDMASEAWLQHIEAAIDAYQPGLVLFDPLGSLASGNENDTELREALVRRFKRLVRKGPTVLVIHHFRKSSQPDDSEDNLIRGSNALKNGSRQTYVLDVGPDDTILVKNIKFSRGRKRPPFALRHHIVTADGDELHWHLARFEYVTPRDAALDAAHAFILEQLADGDRMSTSDLKRAAVELNKGKNAKGAKISGQDISSALNVLELAKTIDFMEGDRGAKLWGLTLPTNSRQGRQGENDLARQGCSLPGQGPEPDATLPASAKRQGGKVDGASRGQRGRGVA